MCCPKKIFKDLTPDEIAKLNLNEPYRARRVLYDELVSKVPQETADNVLNRVQDRRYPAQVCDVIYEGPVKESWKTRQDPDLAEKDRIYYPVRHKCQNGFVCS